MKAKCNQRWLGGAKTASPVALCFLKVGGGGGGKFWVKKTFSSPSFNPSRVGVARPGELTCTYFFREDISMALYGSAFAYSNPLRVDQASNIYFKGTKVIITGNLKDTWLPCSGASRLSRAGQGTTIYRS